ncbi:MAG TPA: 3D domain-containing protein [Chloroflexota bacterium]
MKRPLKTAGKMLILASITIAASLLGATLVFAGLHIDPGSSAVVFGVGQDGLTVREGPGYSYHTQAILPEGTQVDVLSGPRWNGYTPWYLIGGYDPSGQQGWSAGNYLQPAPDPSPPAARATPSSRGGQRDSRGFVGLVTGYSIHGRTASGAPTAWGVVAVDPNVIPLGTKLQIDGFQDVFVAADTGGAIKGNWIDIYFPNYADAYDFGIQARRVTVLDQ